MTKVKEPEDEDHQMVTSEWIYTKLCISRRTLDRIIAGDDNFPPMLVLPGGVRRWNKAAILKWMKDHVK